MIIWHKKMYIGDGVEGIEKMRTDLERKIPIDGVYIIALSNNPDEQLDIFTSRMFIKSLKRFPDPVVVGIASGKDEACNLVAKMAYDIFISEEDVDYRKYFSDRKSEKISDLNKILSE